MVAIYNAATNAVVERYAYTAYGVCQFLDASFGSLTASAYDWTALYTGRALDDESGLYYYRIRYYHSALGVFVGRDFAESDINPFRYCGNNPAGRVDPTGLFCDNLCSSEHASSDVKVDDVALKQANRKIRPEVEESLIHAVKGLLLLNSLKTLVEGAQGGAEAAGAGADAAYELFIHAAVDAIEKLLPVLEKGLAKTNGIRIWVHLDAKCCEYEWCCCWKRLNWQEPDNGGWVPCLAHGKDREFGFDFDAKNAIANAIPGCVRNAIREFKCPSGGRGGADL